MEQSLNTAEGRTLAKSLYQRVYDYFQSEEHRRAFRKWYKKTYGKDYKDKQIGGSNV